MIQKYRTLPGYIIVKLDKKAATAVNKVGLIVPEFEHYETDGGKLSMRPVHEDYYNSGVVVVGSNNIPYLSTVALKDNVKLESIDESDLPHNEKYVVVNELQIKYFKLPVTNEI